MTTLLINCILVASTSAHPKIISTESIRIVTPKPTVVYQCQLAKVDATRPLRRIAKL
jgi:hypothetical protein